MIQQIAYGIVKKQVRSYVVKKGLEVTKSIAKANKVRQSAMLVKGKKDSKVFFYSSDKHTDVTFKNISNFSKTTLKGYDFTKNQSFINAKGITKKSAKLLEKNNSINNLRDLAQKIKLTDLDRSFFEFTQSDSIAKKGITNLKEFYNSELFKNEMIKIHISEETILGANNVNVEKLFENISQYDAKVIDPIIRKTSGKVTDFEIDKKLRETIANEQKLVNTRNYIKERIDTLCQQGDLKLENDTLSYSKKGKLAIDRIHNVQRTLAENNIVNKIEFYKNIGFVNQRGANFQVTDFYVTAYRNKLIDDQLKNTFLKIANKEHKILSLVKDNVETEDFLRALDKSDHEIIDKLIEYKYIRLSNDNELNITSKGLNALVRNTNKELHLNYFDTKILELADEGIITSIAIDKFIDEVAKKDYSKSLSQLEKQNFKELSQLEKRKLETLSEPEKIRLKELQEIRKNNLNKRTTTIDKTNVDLSKISLVSDVKKNELWEEIFNKNFENIHSRISEYERYGIFKVAEKGFKLTEVGTLALDDYIAFSDARFLNIKQNNLVVGEFEKRLFELQIDNKLSIDELLADPKIREYLYQEPAQTLSKGTKEFKLSNYDKNYIGQTFLKEPTTFDKIEKKLLERYTDIDQSKVEIERVKARINKLIENDMIIEKDGVLTSSEVFLKAITKKKEFEFTSFDKNVIFEYVNKSNNKLTENKLKEMIFSEYKNSNEAQKHYNYILNRINKNISLGTLNTTLENGEKIFSISSKGLEKLSSINKDLFDKKLKYLNDLKLISINGDTLTINNVFVDVVDNRNKFTLTKDHLLILDSKNTKGFISKSVMDKIEIKPKYKTRLIKELRSNGHLLQTKKGYKAISPIKINLKDKVAKHINDYDLITLNKNFRLGMFKAKPNISGYQAKTINKFVDLNYMYYDKKTSCYIISDKGRKAIKSVLKDVARVDKKYLEQLKDFKLGDDILNNHIEKLHSINSRLKNKTNFNMENIRDFIDESIKSKEFNVSRSLNNMEYLIFETKFEYPIGFKGNEELSILRIVTDEQMNIVTSYPTSHYSKEIMMFNDVKINMYDVNHILSVSDKRTWNTKDYIEKMTNANKKYDVARIHKRLESLSQNSDYVIKIDSDNFILSDRFLAKATSLQHYKEIGLTDNMNILMSDISKFMNLTHDQISEFIYNSNEFASAEIDLLLKDGFIDFQSRRMYDDNGFERIYYITDKGKKYVKKNLGESFSTKIFDSKLHSRPEELKHDVLIYSAFKHFESTLDTSKYKISAIMTDKEMRSFDMKTNGVQRIEYSDLFIEIEEKASGEKSFVNIEMDCGYKKGVIESKANNIENLIWYTDSSKQLDKIVETLGIETPVVNISL